MTPRPCSSSWMRAETVDWVAFSLCAAAAKLPSRTTVTNVSNCLTFTTPPSRIIEMTERFRSINIAEADFTTMLISPNAKIREETPNHGTERCPQPLRRAGSPETARGGKAPALDARPLPAAAIGRVEPVDGAARHLVDLRLQRALHGARRRARLRP